MGSARQSLSLLRVRQWRLPTIPFTGSLYGEDPGRSFLFARNDLKAPRVTRCGPHVLHVDVLFPTIESNLYLHLGGWRLVRKTGLFSQTLSETAISVPHFAAVVARAWPLDGPNLVSRHAPAGAYRRFKSREQWMPPGRFDLFRDGGWVKKRTTRLFPVQGPREGYGRKTTLANS